MALPDQIRRSASTIDAKTPTLLCVDPVTRILEALTEKTGLLVVRAYDSRADAWLSDERIESALFNAILGPTEIEIWTPAAGARIVSIEFPKSTAGPMRAVELHTLNQRFYDQLANEWAEQTDQPLAFSVTPITPLTHLDVVKQNISDLNSLLDILDHKKLTPQFQPIVSLRDGRVFAYETLIRGPKGAALRRPGQMFRVANRARLVAWFDLACLEVCLETAAEQRLKHLLFVNMDAEGLSALAMEDRPIGLRVGDHGFSPGDVVIEITERQTIGDFPRLLDDIQQIRDQGFRIAIDDAGAGYSSLRAISELKPEFVKIDRDIVKNVEIAGERRALLKAVAQFAHQSGATVIAEGAETREEVATLIDLGIPYCQGYFLGKPADSLRGTPRPVREFVQECVAVRERRTAGLDLTMQQIARPGLLVSGDTPIPDAVRRFTKAPGLTSIAVFANGRVEGLLLRSQLEQLRSVVGSNGVAKEFEIETVDRWVHSDVLRTEGGMLITDVIEQVVTQQNISLDGDVLVLDSAGNYEGVVPIRMLMEAAANHPVRRALYTDPLTGMPGRVALERELKTRLNSNASLAVVRLDLTTLSNVNELVGLTGGDALIVRFGELIMAASFAAGVPDDLCAHLGGDDFVILTREDTVDRVCFTILDEFTKIKMDTYQGPQDTSDIVTRSSVCTIAIAAVTNRTIRLKSRDQVMGRLSDLMRQVKGRPGNRIAIDNAPLFHK